jgi:hypothetical protein
MERLRFAGALDGRPVTEWARAALAEAADHALLSRPGWAWARPGAPYWACPAILERVEAAPIGGLGGLERVLLIARAPGAFVPPDDPEGDGTGFLADVVPLPEVGGPTLRRVLLRASDVLPFRRV